MSKNDPVQFNELEDIERELDSLKQIYLQRKRPVYKVNANTISDYKGYQLGLSIDQIDRMFAFRTSGKYFLDIKQFQRVLGINDSLRHQLDSVLVFPKFPDYHKAQRNNTKDQFVKKGSDLNKATFEQLRLLDIDDRMARRILAYRRKLIGFSMNDQLYEVYGLDSSKAHAIFQYFKVITPPRIMKANVNTATFKELLKLPYMDYDLVKRICQERDRVLVFEKLTDLKKIDSFPLDKFDRIALYLTAE